MKRALFVISIALVFSVQSYAFEVDELDEVVGFTLIAVTDVPGEFEGGDFNKTVRLANGMVFEFTSYAYTYAYQPSAAVFAKKVTLGKPGKQPAKDVILYKLLIEDEIFDVIRLR
jgi:hypothetical protein